MTIAPDTESPDNGSAAAVPDPSSSSSTRRSILPQFAIDAADAQIATWSSAIVDAADTIERLVSSESLPVPAVVRDLATSTTEKLRSFGTKSGEQDAAELVAGLQRTAAAHPAASIGVGAAIGAALVAVLVKLGGPTSNAGSPSAHGEANKTSTGRTSARSGAGSTERPSQASAVSGD